MTTIRIASRRSEGVPYNAPQNGLALEGVQVTQDSQVPPQGDQVSIGDEANVPVVPPDITNGDIREDLFALA